MKQKFKFLSLLCALMLMCTGQAMAYESWTSTNHSDYSTSEHTWNIPVTAGQYIKFNYSVSSEDYCDWLTVTIDGEEVIRVSGEESSTCKYYCNSSGSITIIATYSKDGGVSCGSDRGMITQIFAGDLNLKVGEKINVNTLMEMDQPIRLSVTNSTIIEKKEENNNICILGRKEGKVTVYVYDTSGNYLNDFTVNVTKDGLEDFVSLFNNGVQLKNIENTSFYSDNGIKSQTSGSLICDFEVTVPYIRLNCSYRERISMNSWYITNFNIDGLSYKDNVQSFILPKGTHRLEFPSTNVNNQNYYSIEDFYFINDSENIDTIIVKRPGTLGGEALKIRKNLKDFSHICVVGPFDEYDWKTIDEMGLTYLDLTDAEDTAYPATVSSTILCVKMSKYITEIKHNPFPNVVYMYLPKEVSMISVTKFTSNNTFALDGCDGLTSIPEHAFDNSKICFVSFPSLTEIPEYAFNQCNNLASVNLPKVTSLGNYAFYQCEKLETVDLPEVTKIGDSVFEAKSERRYDYSTNTYYYYPLGTLMSFFAPTLEEVGYRAFFNQNKMQNAETLNLKKIGEHAFYYCQQLKNVDLSGAKSVPEYAFYECNNMTVPSMESLGSIGIYAFYNCTSIKEAIIPNAKSIGFDAFKGCSSITALDARRATSIGEAAFSGCSNLKTANLSNTEKIYQNAFYGCSSLQEINLPEVSYLGAQAFSGCSSATSINMSDKLTQIGDKSFYGCTAAEQITLPASLMHLPSQCFSGSTNIKTINCNAPAPPTVGDVPFYMQTVYTATLRVPESSLKLYQADFYWKHFYYMETNPDEVTDLTIRTEIPYGENRFDKINLTIAVGGALEMSGTKSQAFRSVTFEADKNGAGALLSNTQRINSDATKVALNMEGLKWYFFTLPFDAQITDIDNTNDAQLAIYSYDGAHRAQYGTGGNWTRHTSGTLTANKGYIVQASKATDITFKATYETKNTPFLQGDKTIALDANTSSTASNKGWNYIGNPYAAYYDISYMDFTAPITVWNGSTYQAYSVEDDEFALKPLQSFFVQCPTNVTAIAFDKDGRQMNSTVQRASAAKGIVKSQRKVIDIVLSDDSNSDRTRIVVNGDATDDYDMDRDAAKMMSMDETVPQLYTERDGEQYAINEGPQSTGIVDLGLYIPAAGRYTIKATRSDISAYVVDALTGKRELLTKGMTFEAEQGVMAGRMSIELADDEDVTAVDATVADAEGQEIYDLGGKKLDGKQSGINIIRRGADVKKSVVR